MSRIAWVVVVLALALALVMAVMRPHGDEGGAPEPTAVEAITGGVVPIFLFELSPGLADQPLPIPDDNPMSAEKILLGEWLFFDVRLSETKQMSCETCHVPEQGWADGRARSPKHDGSLNVRHTPSLYGAGFFPELYWDGRAQGLEAQVRAAWEGQMGARPARIAAELGQMSGYRGAFQEAFGGPPTADRIVNALATFVRTIHAGDTPWDRHPKDEAALDETEVGRGFRVFSKVAQCTLCHRPPVFTDTQFHNVGIGMAGETPHAGRAAYLAATAARVGAPAGADANAAFGAFKTPSLRGVTRHPPYFHDGRAETLEAAVDLILAGGVSNPALDEKLVARRLTPEQRASLLAFLAALAPDASVYLRPVLPY